MAASINLLAHAWLGNAVQYVENVQLAVASIHQIVEKGCPVACGSVLGTGLERVRRRMTIDRVIDDADIKGFPRSSAPGLRANSCSEA